MIRGVYFRAVIKRWGPGISAGYYERGPRPLSKENRRKIEPKETPSCLIPRLLFVFSRQLKILVTTLLFRSGRLLGRLRYLLFFISSVIGDGPIQLWQQILQLLVLPPSSELESGLVEWTRKQKYGFRILQPQKLAQLWGKVKNKPAMNSEKLFRGLRYYYGKSMLEKVPGQENTYQFVFDITEILGYDPVDGIPVVTPSKEGSPVDQNGEFLRSDFNSSENTLYLS